MSEEEKKIEKANFFYIDNIPKSKSILKIGNERNIKIELDVKFNKLQKFMWKHLLNIEIENLNT